MIWIIWQNYASTCQCHLMIASQTHQPRRGYSTRCPMTSSHQSKQLGQDQSLQQPIANKFSMYKQLVGRIWTLSPLDLLMEENKGNRDFFIALFDRKAMLLRLIKQYKIDAKHYLKQTTKACQDPHFLVIKCAEQDLKQLKDSSSKLLIQEWFNQMIENAKAHQSEQTALYAKCQTLKEQSQIRVTVQDVQKSLIVLAKSKILESKIKQKEQINEKELVSFRAIDSLLQQHESDQQIYKRVIERKRIMMSLVEKKTMTPHMYRSYLEDYINRKIKNKDILFESKREFEGLSLFHNDCVEPWFEELYTATKTHLFEQKSVLLSLSSKIPVNQKMVSSPELNKGQEQPQTRIVNSTVEINVTEDRSFSYVLGEVSRARDSREGNEVRNLRVLEYLLAKNRENPEIFASLFVQKREMWSGLKSGRINCETYHQMQQDQLIKAKTEQIRQTVRNDLTLLRDNCNHNVNQWVKLLLDEAQESYEEQKRIYHQILAHRQANVVDQSQRRKKLQSFLKAMAAYESLLYYFKRHEIPYTTHTYLTEYEANKRLVYEYIDKHETDHSYDISNLTADLFPPLNPIIFYAGELQNYKARLEVVQSDLKKQVEVLTRYKQELERESNTSNICLAELQIEDCRSNINYLAGWPHNTYEAFPEVTYHKVTKTYVDLHTLGPSELEVEISSVTGIEQDLFLNIHMFQQQNQEKSSLAKTFRLTKGYNKRINYSVNLTEPQMRVAMEGSHQYLTFIVRKNQIPTAQKLVNLLEQLGRTRASTRFKDTNVNLLKIEIAQLTIDCIVRVHKPLQSKQTQVEHISIKTYPSYAHDVFIEEELIKKMVPYSRIQEEEEEEEAVG